MLSDSRTYHSAIRTLLPAFLCFLATPSSALQAVVMKNLFFAPTENHSFKPYIETYWQVDPQSMLFSKEDGFFVGKIRTQISIRRDTGVVTEEQYLLTTTPVASGTELYRQKIIDLRRYELQPGNYTLEILLTDELKTDSRFVFRDSFSIEPVTAPSFSDIQLVDTMLQGDVQSIFSRNGVIQLPLCTNFFDEQRKTLHYYTELYQPAADTHSTLMLTTYVSKKPFDPPVNRLIIQDTLSKKNVHLVEGKLALNTLASGNYYLNITAVNDQQQRIAAQTLFFQVLNAKPEALADEKMPDTASGLTPEENTTYLNLNKTFLGKYTPEQIRAILKMLLPIADPNERNSIQSFLKNPNDLYSRYFVYNFWSRRNKLKPEEAWKEYSGRVKEVNKLFGSSLLTGYESERGLIYLKYGAPTERIIVNNESNALPYEIWQYNTLARASNAVFLFYRAGMLSNDYRLLHTTVNGERRNRNWRSVLFVGGASADASASRAEQYIGNR